MNETVEWVKTHNDTTVEIRAPDVLSKIGINADALYWASSDLHIKRLHLEGWSDDDIWNAVKEKLTR